MIEVPLGMMAWMGVVLFQAIVHYYGIGPRRRRGPHDNAILLTSATANNGISRIQSSCNTGQSGDDTPQPMSPCLRAPKFSDDEREIDDDPRQIRRLLGLTGSEFVNVSEDH